MINAGEERFIVSESLGSILDPNALSADNDESQCEADMTEKLDDLSGEQQIDPRWEALKDLKGKIE